MLTDFFRRLVAFSIAAFTTLAAFFGTTLGDKFDPERFPQLPTIGIEDKADNTIRVMSFNIRNGDVGGVEMAQRRGLVPLEIDRVQPDSVGLQEVTEDWRYVLRVYLKNYACVGVARNEKNKGEANWILYNRANYICRDSGTFWLSETPDVPSSGWDAACNRICTWAVLENRKTGVQYVHVNSHYDHISEEARQHEAKIVCDFIREKFPELPLVFTADMNSRENSVAYAEMTKLLTDAKYGAADSIFCDTFHNLSSGNTSCIDYILYRNIQPVAFRVVSEGIEGRFVSDHFPLYADFVLTE